jgi:hypothetical protein
VVFLVNWEGWYVLFSFLFWDLEFEFEVWACILVIGGGEIGKEEESICLTSGK